MKKVVVGASSFAESDSEAINLLYNRGIDVVKNPFKRKLTQEETIAHLQGAIGVLAGLEPLNEEVFKQCPQLKVIARIGIGMDNVDIKAAQKYNIKVSNTPDAPTDAVAEMVLTALLNICHNIIPLNKKVHEGVWEKQMGKSISELKILIIGYGHIGKRTAQILSSLGAKIMIYDKYSKEESTCTLEDGLKDADVISLHASGNSEIISEKQIEIMKDGVILLNSARGKLINENALYLALKNGKISAFWGDVLWEEPYNGILCECNNAILTPHVSTYTTTCRKYMEMQAVKNLLGDLENV